MILMAVALVAGMLVSNVVAELCAGKRLPFQDVGEITLKGFDRPIRIVEQGFVHPFVAYPTIE
jgi:class 3 adenylate cyclase